MADNTSTTKKYLDYTGLVYLWQKIKNTFVKKTDLANGETAGIVKGTKTVTDTTGYSEAPIVNGVVYYKDTDTVYDDSTTVKTTGTDKNLADGNVVLGAGGKNVKDSGVSIGGTTLSTNADGTILATETAVNTALTTLRGEISNLENVMNLLGVVQLAEGATFDTTNATVSIIGEEGTVTAEDGDVVVCGNKEYLWSKTSWIEVGQVNTDEAVTSLGGVKGDITLGTALKVDGQALDVKLDATGNVELTTSADGLKADVEVTPGTEALAFGATTTIATVAGTDITVTLPADPTSDIEALSTDEIDAAIDEAEADA